MSTLPVTCVKPNSIEFVPMAGVWNTWPVRPTPLIPPYSLYSSSEADPSSAGATSRYADTVWVTLAGSTFLIVIPTKIDLGAKLILMNSLNWYLPSLVARVMFQVLGTAPAENVAGPKPVDDVGAPGL